MIEPAALVRAALGTGAQSALCCFAQALSLLHYLTKREPRVDRRAQLTHFSRNDSLFRA
jgi:hypothetical protein